jgi:DNA-binding transcriptional regulator LsrR (DeoR family)
MDRERSEGDVNLEEDESAAGTAPAGDQPVGRVQGQDLGYAGETGAEARAEEAGEGSGNAVSEADQAALRRAHAVGDICLHFFDEQGQVVASPFDDRVLGIDLETLRKVPRVVAVAGGDRKYTAIRAALLGGWVNVLITDLAVAQRLVD